MPCIVINLWWRQVCRARPFLLLPPTTTSFVCAAAAATLSPAQLCDPARSVSLFHHVAWEITRAKRPSISSISPFVLSRFFSFSTLHLVPHGLSVLHSRWYYTLYYYNHSIVHIFFSYKGRLAESFDLRTGGLRTGGARGLRAPTGVHEGGASTWHSRLAQFIYPPPPEKRIYSKQMKRATLPLSLSLSLYMGPCFTWLFFTANNRSRKK